MCRMLWIRNVSLTGGSTELGKGLGTKLGAGVQELGAEPPATWQVPCAKCRGTPRPLRAQR